MSTKPGKLHKIKMVRLFPKHAHKEAIVAILSIILLILLPLVVIILSKQTNFFSKAAGITTIEAETGIRTGNVSVVSNTNASGGSYVKFGNVNTSAARFPGDPNPKVLGKAYWGASIAGNGDPVRHESPTGKSLSVRRTFYTWDDHATAPNDSLFNTVRADHAANRLPFVSTKTPPWQEVANGLHDARIDQLLLELDKGGKPVWLTFHHEPEGGGGVNAPDDPGGASAWRGMQTKVRERMNALGTKNIAFMPILMSWTWDTRSGRNPADWWVPNVWDAYIVDSYNDSLTGDMISAPGWNNFVAWAEARNMPFGTGEWGNRGTDAQAAQEMQSFWDWGFINNKDLIVHSYFDSGLNSPSGSWELVGEPLTKFQDILKNDSRVQRINDTSSSTTSIPGWTLRWQDDISKGLGTFEGVEDDRFDLHPEATHIFAENGIYRFVMHLADRDQPDRQRQEVYGMRDASSNVIKMKQGETWKQVYEVFIPTTHDGTTGFNHINQVKQISLLNGRDANTPSSPIATLSLLKGTTSGNETMAMISHYPTPVAFNAIPLAPLQGKWIEIENEYKFDFADNGGYMRMVVRENGTVITDNTKTNVEMWTTEGTGNDNWMRPKWGIYRAISSTNLQDTYMEMRNMRWYQKQ